jgi:hypothetical protein
MLIITDLLEKKHRLYRRLKENMQVFKTALEGGEEVRIEPLTREREEILKTIDALDRQLSRAGYCLGVPGPAEGKSNGLISSWVGKIKEVWEDIFSLNLECLQFAEIRCRDLKSEMATMGREVQNVKKYIAPNPYSPRFIDFVN